MSSEDETVQQVRDFIGGDEKRLKLIERIVEHEENNIGDKEYFNERDGYTDTAWETGSDVSMAPAYIGMLKNAPFINIVLDTNSTNALALSDRRATQRAVQLEKDEPDEYSEEWIDREIEQVEGKFSEIIGDVDVGQDDVETIKELTKSNDALSYWSQYVVPNLKFRPNAKKAILVMLASPEDKHGNKGRINVMIYGKPGTGKTTIKKYLKKEFAAETIDGARVSKSDLTYNKNSDEFGKLPKAHKGIIVIEEADEMDSDALGSALTSLGESGQVEIRDMEIPAETRGVTLSNFESRHDILTSWSPESLNRFDFLIKFELLEDEQKNEALDDIYRNFRQPTPDDNLDLLKKYLKLARSFEPKVKNMDDILEYKQNNISSIENIREGISVMNVAWTIARLNFEDLTVDHYKQALDIVSGPNESALDKF